MLVKQPSHHFMKVLTMESNPNLELDAAQALFAARMLEAAVHHPGPWAFRWGGIEVPATKTITERGVTFTGAFPDVCYLHPPQDGLLILCEGTVMGMRRMDLDHPGDTGFLVTWDVLSHRSGVRQ
jgi:hypothetical protein